MISVNPYYPSTPTTPPGAGDSQRSMRSILYNLQERNNRQNKLRLLKELLNNNIIDITAYDLKDVMGTPARYNNIKIKKTLEKIFKKLNNFEISINKEYSPGNKKRSVRTRHSRIRHSRKRHSRKRHARKRHTRKRHARKRR